MLTPTGGDKNVGAAAPDGPAGSDWDACLFVWSIWALLLLASLGLVWHYGRNVPVADEWDWVVPMVAGQQPLSLGWLWGAYGYNRHPVQKSMLVGLFKIAGNDFRAAMYFDALYLGTLAFGMIMVARRLRGRTSYADAFFPLLFLHLGRDGVALTNMLIGSVLTQGLAGTFLLIVFSQRGRLTPAAAAAAGTCLLLIPLCGGAGFLFTPIFGLWLGYVGVRQWLSGRPRARSAAVVAFAFCGVLTVMMGFYYLDIYPGEAGMKRTPWTVLKTILEIFTCSLGCGAYEVWPYTGLAVSFLFLLGAATLAFAILRPAPDERPRALGLLLYLCFAAGLALILARYRTGYVSDYYGLLPSLGLCVVYFGVALYGPHGLGRLVQMCLLSISAALLPLQVQWGLNYARSYHSGMAAFEEDLRAGNPLHVLLARHTLTLTGVADDADTVRNGLRMLRDAGFGDYRLVGEDPPFRKVPLAIEPADLSNMTWEDGTARGKGSADSPGDGTSTYVEFALPEPTYVAGIHIEFTHARGTGLNNTYGDVQVSWKDADQADWPPSPQFMRNGTYGAVPFIVWTAARIDRFRVYPDATDPATWMQFLEITLLVPEENPPPAPAEP